MSSFLSSMLWPGSLREGQHRRLCTLRLGCLCLGPEGLTSYSTEQTDPGLTGSKARVSSCPQAKEREPPSSRA